MVKSLNIIELVTIWELKKYSYKDPNGNVVIEKEYIKDLGVYISSDLTWTRQINEVVSEARSMSGWALRILVPEKRST